MKIKPLRNNVVIKADKDDGKEGSFLIAREWEKLPQTGTVLSVGPDVTEVKPDDYVRFNRYAFEKIGSEEFIGLDKNIVAIL
jgi:co-chaperonin GroES (HSP10)